jgi:hypothetical protein
MSGKRVCPYKTEAERESAKKRSGDDCCCCIKARFQPWHGSTCPHGMP